VFANGDAGLYVKGEYDYKSADYSHKNIYIRNVKAYDNLGRPDSKQNTGSGIVLSDTENGLIEHCIAYNNGALCHSELGGPVGIWAWDAKNVIIQHNESFNNKTGSIKDGGGFDLDGGTVNSIMQYNYSHDNDGAGFFLAQFSYARPHTGNTIRYNISYNDGRKNSYAGIEVWGACENANIYNNTVMTSASPQSKPAALSTRPNDELGIKNLKLPGNITISNNIFLAVGKMELIRAVNPLPSIKMINNNYYNFNSEVCFRWKENEYNSFGAWRKATSQEMDGNNMGGYSVNPLITYLDANLNMSGNDAMNIHSFQLADKSPMINAGINTFKLSGNLGKADRDIINVIVPQNGLFDLGACEYPEGSHQLTSNHK
jgi:hypothetical protein